MLTTVSSAGFASIGAIASAANPKPCSAIEIASARRLALFPRFLSSALPSTRHSPKFAAPDSTFTISFPLDITHLRTGFQGCTGNPFSDTEASETRFTSLFSRCTCVCLSLREPRESATLPHRLLQVAVQWPARRSQGCEVARVLKLLDTGCHFRFPLSRFRVNCPHKDVTPFLVNLPKSL